MDKISALMDGEAAGMEEQQALNRLRQDPACREAWECFHIVGDVMRGTPVLREDFVTRLKQRMENEPTVLAPRLRAGSGARMVYSAAAAVAGVAIVLTLVMTNNPLRPQQNIAASPKPADIQVAQSAAGDLRPQPASLANPEQVNEYLLAHQEFSPRTALQGVVPYVRSVSASHDGGRR